MKKKPQEKYIFTQVSAVLVAIISAGISIYLLKKMIVEKEISTITIIIQIIIPISSIFISWKIWAELLVKMNVLNKNESKGYPYSKPWKNKAI